MSASIPILWRCFHYHAYFPFSQETEQLDYSAFQRAIGLLAAEGSLCLGDNADGVTMDADRHPDADARASKQLWMIFKSLSIRFPHPSRPKVIESSVVGFSTIEEDLMDVLCLTQPDDPCIMPAPIEELRPHAKRILSTSNTSMYSSIPRGDFLSLIKLLLSVQLDKPEWGGHEPYFYTGRILTHPDSTILQGAANAVLRRLTSSETRDVNWHVFQNVLTVYIVRSLCRTSSFANAYNQSPISFLNSVSSSQAFSHNHARRMKLSTYPHQSPPSLSHTRNISTCSSTLHSPIRDATSSKNSPAKKLITLFKPLKPHIQPHLSLSTSPTSSPLSVP